MVEEIGLVSYEDLAAIEDEFQEIDTEICKDCALNADLLGCTNA